MKASRLILLAVVLLAMVGSAMTALLLSTDHSPELGQTVHIRTVQGPVDPETGSTPSPGASTSDKASPSSTPTDKSSPSSSSPSKARTSSPSTSTASKPAPQRHRSGSQRQEAKQVTRTPPRAGVYDDDDDDDDWDDNDRDDDDEDDDD